MDWEVSDYHEFIGDIKKTMEFNRGGSDMTRMLKHQMTGKINTGGSERFITTLDKSHKRDFEFKKFEVLDTIIIKEFAGKFSLRSRAIDKIKRLLKSYSIN